MVIWIYNISFFLTLLRGEALNSPELFQGTKLIERPIKILARARGLRVLLKEAVGRSECC